MGGYSLQQGQLLSMPLKKIAALLQQLMLKLSLGGEVGLPQDETVTGCADPQSCGVSTGVVTWSLQKIPFAANLPILGSYILSTPSPLMSPEPWSGCHSYCSWGWAHHHRLYCFGRV